VWLGSGHLVENTSVSFSDSLELRILDSAFGGVAFTPDTTLYIGLSSADPGETGAANAEPSGGNYGRVAVTNNTTNFPAGIPKDNGTVITFLQASANWLSGVDLTHFTVWNHATLTAPANLLGSGLLTTAKPVMSGDTASFAIGALVITLD
jgi:hypothetical protein